MLKNWWKTKLNPYLVQGVSIEMRPIFIYLIQINQIRSNQLIWLKLILISNQVIIISLAQRLEVMTVLLAAKRANNQLGRNKATETIKKASDVVRANMGKLLEPPATRII